MLVLRSWFLVKEQRTFLPQIAQIIADLFNPKPVLVETGIGNPKLVPAKECHPRLDRGRVSKIESPHFSYVDRSLSWLPHYFFKTNYPAYEPLLRKG